MPKPSLPQWLKPVLDQCAANYRRTQAFVSKHTNQLVNKIKQFYSQRLKPTLSKTGIITARFQQLFRAVTAQMTRILRLIGGLISAVFLICWSEIRKLKINNKTIGAWVDDGLHHIKQIPWVQNLLEATQYDTRGPTLVSTCFANVLALVFPLALMQVYDRIVPNRTINTLVFLTIGVVLAFIVDAVLRIIRSYINLWADTKYEFLLGKSAFEKIISAPMYANEKTDVGTRLRQFMILDQLKGFYNTQLLTSVYEIPFLLVFLIVIAYLGSWLVLIPIAVAGFATYITWYFSRHTENLIENKIIFEAKESDFIINVLTGIHTAKSIGMEELLTRRHERLQETGTGINYLSSVHEGDLNMIRALSSQSITVLTATFGSMLVIQGGMAIGGLAACILLAGRVMQPFDRVLTAFNRLSMINLVRRRLDPIFELPAEIQPTDALPNITEGNIVLKNISYDFGDEPKSKILSDLDFAVPTNSLTGITGGSQNERAALLNILATIAQPASGDYYIDNKKVSEYNTHALHKKIAYLNRVGKLFRGSIMDNLSAFDEQLIPTARRLVDRLGLNAVLSKLPNGYDTFVGEKAVEALPGGVMNMIFIIRALVSKPKIILFDEANINLDTQFSANMINLLAYLKEQAAVIVFASKPSTIAMMDMVYHFENKKLVRVNHHAS